MNTERRERRKGFRTVKKAMRKAASGAGLIGGLAIFVSALGIACAPTSPLYEPIVGSSYYVPAVGQMASYTPDASLVATFRAGLGQTPNGATWAEDGALNCAAALIGGHTIFAHERQPTDTLKQWLAWRCGAVSKVGTSWRKFWGRRSARPETGLINSLYADAVNAGKQPLVSFGLAGENATKRHWFELVTSSRIVSIRPLPKVFSAGAPIDVEGCSRVVLVNPALFITGDGATVSEYPVVLDGQRCFHVRALVPQVAGVYYVELQSDHATGAAPAFTWGRTKADVDDTTEWASAHLWFPIYVDVDEPSSPPAVAFSPIPNGDETSWRATVLSVYNAERARHGLKTMTLGTAWQAVLDSEASARVRRLPEKKDADLPPDLVTSYVGRRSATAVFFSEYARTALTMPRVRSYILNAKTTELNIGIAAYLPEDDDPRDLPRYAVVEYFGKMRAITKQ